MRSFGWLHLTDLHRGMSEQSWLWPNIEQQFFEDLEVVHDRCGPWDAIFWSGDLVQRGASNEFKRFSVTISRLYSKLRELGSNPVFVPIPGNHDLVRPRFDDEDVANAFKHWNDNPEIARDFWSGDRADFEKVFKKAFRNYVAWKKRHAFQRASESNSGQIPGDCATSIKIQDLKIGILGLNTAFLQLDDQDYKGKLALSVAQLVALCGEHFTDWFAQHHCNFLMTHHPPDWLHESSQRTLQQEIAVPGRFVAHLFGHMHEPYSVSKSVGGAAPLRFWQGPSLFGLETFGANVERRHGYSAGKLEFRGDKGVLRLWPRMAQRHQAGHWHFIQDTSVTLQPDDGTEPEQFTVNVISTQVRALFRVLILSTNADLEDARKSSVTHLRTSLGIEVSDSEQRPLDEYDAVVLIQGWRWEGGAIAKRWQSVNPSKQIAFVAREGGNWPPLKLVDVASLKDVVQFRSQIVNTQGFDDPGTVPELIGAVITEKLQRLTGGTTTGLKAFERSYLEFRIPVWRSGRTALSQPHLFDAADAKELYQPDLYTALHGTSIDWIVGREGRPKKMSAKAKRKVATEIDGHEKRVRLARWIGVEEIPRIALIGAPGGGKTIFLTRIAAAIGSACLGRPVDFEPDLDLESIRRNNWLPVPVVIEATRIAQRDPSAITALLSAMEDEMASASTARPTAQEIEEGLQKGRYFLLIDALDEIADATLRSSVLYLLKSMAELYPETHILLTTRSARYTGRLRFGPVYHSVEVAGLDEGQIDQLCTNWTTNRKRDETYRSLLMTAVSGLADQVASSKSDQALTENPLMLTAICMVFERYRSLPDDRGRLCELLIEDLCRSRRSEEPSRGWKLDEAGKKDLLQRIALAMQEEGAQTWPFDRAVEIALNLVPATESERRNRAKRYVDWAADHTGILRFQEASEDQEQIRFWHRLFREYLSASRLAQEDTTAGDKIDKLWRAGRLSDPFWEDVIRLMPRTLGTIEKARSLRERFESLAAANPSQRGRLLGLSAAGIIENRDLFPDVAFDALAISMANIYEKESDTWCLSDRLLYLDALGRLDLATCDPRMKAERWVEPLANGAFAVHHRTIPSNLELAYAWAPVTVQEYWKFASSPAFMDLAFWTYCPQRVLAYRSVLSSQIQAQMRHPNRPVVRVGVYAAVAYCEWKTTQRKDARIVRLPDVAEWRKLLLSSGAHRKILGAKDWPVGDKALFNWRGASIGCPSPVGAFSPVVCGAIDVLGNVWEWLVPTKGEGSHFHDGSSRLYSFPVGGGSYNYNPPGKTTRMTSVPPPNLAIRGHNSIGFRCVLSKTKQDLKPLLSQIRETPAMRAEDN